MPLDYDYEERAAIMQYCGGWSKADAEKLARERPWKTDKWWGVPKPQQTTFSDDPLANECFSEVSKLVGGW
ncbi:hypothetical protein [Geobacter sp. SVR]|uniref:hypothetical protein n=1 Tax=Geobacter sp. SVR TaxID=2495594 RepID=UPI00143EFA73|nr:hypothetical protein [Geobacter sp. SVR]BCS55172.1 hypothetical protein GSVR_34800 [Geobacter sp. SVR]GCF85353.1 hypothetical protein GSbR_19530 [Geobacter sp. SVR]